MTATLDRLRSEMEGEDRHAHNPEVEKAVLAILLDGRHPTAWDTALEIVQTPLAFSVRDHRIVFLGCLQLAAEGSGVNAQAVAECLSAMDFGTAMDRLRAMEGLKGKLPPLGDHERCGYEESALVAVGGFNAISDLSTVFSPAVGLERNCKILAEHYRQRRVINDLCSALDRLRKPQGVREVDEILDGMLNATLASTRVQGSEMLVDGADQALAAHDLIQSGQPTRRALFGIPCLDRLVRMDPGQVIIVAAAPKCGKTSLALHAVTATAQKYGRHAVAAVSVEMSNRELASVMIARRLQCAVANVKDGRLDQGQREQADVIRGELGDMGVDVRDIRASCSMRDIEAWARAKKRLNPGLALLLVDYLQLIEGDQRHTEYQRVTDNSRRLKKLAGELQIPALVLSQMNRDGRKQERGRGGDLKAEGRPQLSDLRGSGAIEQDADAVIFLWRPDPAPEAKIIRAELAAYRHGPTGYADLAFWGGQGQRFADLNAKEEEAPPHSSGRTRHDRINNQDKAEEPPF